jgi:hypothetical protein
MFTTEARNAHPQQEAQMPTAPTATSNYSANGDDTHPAPDPDNRQTPASHHNAQTAINHRQVDAPYNELSSRPPNGQLGSRVSGDDLAVGSPDGLEVRTPTSRIDPQTAHNEPASRPPNGQPASRARGYELVYCTPHAGPETPTAASQLGPQQAPHNQPELRAADARHGIGRERARRLRAGAIRRMHGNAIRRMRARAERGAITAEYAILIVGACGLGGVLVALLRSPAMQGVLNAIINYGLKIAGVEGVHL